MATFQDGKLYDDDDPALLNQPSYGQSLPGVSAPQSTPSPMTPSFGGASTAVQPQKTFFDQPSSSQATFDSRPPTPPAAPTQVTNTPPMLPNAAPQDQVNRYQEIVKALDAQQDPTARGIMQDELARTLFSDLKNAGHDVKWKDATTLMVDGRPYTVAGSAFTANAATANNANPTPSTGGGQSWAGLTGKSLVTNPDYVRYRLNEAWKQAHGGQDMPADRLDYFTSKALTPDTFTGGDIRVGISDYWIDRAVNPNAAGGSGADRGGDDTLVGWNNSDGGGGGGGGNRNPANIDLAGGAADVQINMPSYSGAPAAPQGFQLTGPSYQPGEIDMLDTFDPLAGSEDVDAATRAAILKLFEAGEVDQKTQEALLKLLENPESMDPRTVEMLKGKSREEAGALYEQQDEEMKRAGFAGGFDDSRWLASERQRAMRGRDESIIGKNRDIDIQAATTNMADRRAAIEQGASYASQRAARDAAAVQAGNTYEALKADTAIRTASLKGDRLQLREQMNQKAAELGLSGDQLQLQYTLGLLNNATQKYGIDVGAALDEAKLKQAGREFQEELAFKFAALDQADAQFGAQYGLDAGRLESDINQRGFDNWYKSTHP